MYIFQDLWKGAGWGTIVYLAAITNVDEQLILIGVLLPIYFSALSGLTKINLDTATLRTNQRFVNEELAAPDDFWNQTSEATLSLTVDHPVISIGNHSFSFLIEETLRT